MAERARGLRKGNVQPGKVSPAVVAVTAGYILRLAARLRRLRPDLVHANSLKSGVYGSLAARLVGVPFVWHVRDRIATDYLPGSAVAAIRFMTRNLTAAVIANSHATMRTLDPEAQPVILYSVVPEALAPPVSTREVRGDGPITVGMIGRLAPWKGQDLFLRAFAEAFPTGDTRCVLVGAALFGEDDYERELRELTAGLGLDGRVEFRGFKDDPWRELARMDMLVHASIIPEPFGQVILEGMAARVPVVAADAGGPSELICHDVNGVLYPMGDQAALADAIRRLADDPGRRRRLTEGGRASVGAHHPDAVAVRLEELYREVVDKAHTGG
jgi:glycosyltransferase involved in cell wall biosynthesis